MIETECPICDDTTFYDVTVVARTLRSRRLKCHACERKLKPKESKKIPGYFLFWEVADRDLPGMMVLVCKDCASHCEECRYDFEETV